MAESNYAGAKALQFYGVRSTAVSLVGKRSWKISFADAGKDEESPGQILNNLQRYLKPSGFFAEIRRLPDHHLSLFVSGCATLISLMIGLPLGTALA
jgi:hypothetical protein